MSKENSKRSPTTEASTMDIPPDVGDLRPTRNRKRSHSTPCPYQLRKRRRVSYEVKGNTKCNK